MKSKPEDWLTYQKPAAVEATTSKTRTRPLISATTYTARGGIGAAVYSSDLHPLSVLDSLTCVYGVDGPYRSGTISQRCY